MRSKALQKLLSFLVIWSIYLSAGVAIGLIGVLVVAPALVYLKFGQIQITPSYENAFKIAKGIVFSSFALAVVMWGWGELRGRLNSDVDKDKKDNS